MNILVDVELSSERAITSATHCFSMTRWRNITDNCLDVAKCVADKVDGNGWWEPVELQRSWLMDVDQLLNSANKYLCPHSFKFRKNYIGSFVKPNIILQGGTGWMHRRYSVKRRFNESFVSRRAEFLSKSLHRSHSSSVNTIRLLEEKNWQTGEKEVIWT